ncbi:hypothetical protein F2Q68_00016284 [Brassica cretica]|uniref:SWIM-type domain-containing protein n=1 Tax=Brassica cretica TaxID=69181 RepID=A0A8S9HLC6_BRACR|nr:hypothetical protein F2Q68_00016284 [Brassica cretica]
MFLVPDGYTHGELLEMAQEDYGLDKKIEKVVLTYSLPDVILQKMAPDTPPMHSQVQAGVDDDVDVSDGDDSIFPDEDTGQNTDEEWDEDSNAADDVQATADDVQATADVDVDVDDGVNYSDYGKVKDEDSDEDANETLYDGHKAQCSGGEGRLLSLNDNIYVGQSFASKAELDSKLKLVAVKCKFTFTAYKTTKTLDVANCRVQGCGWKLRASVKHGPKTFWRCQCGVFNIEKIPCSHAIAAAKDVNIHVSTLVCPSYSKNYLYAAYASNIYPKSNVLEAPNTDDTSPANEEGASNTRKCLPSDVKRGPGRQKKSRWQSWLEISRMRENQLRKLHKDYSCS